MAVALRHRLGYCPISVDTERDIIGNHDATFKLSAQNAPLADWHIAIEDDTDPIPDFYQQADAALAQCPAKVASLYFGFVGQRRRNTHLLLHLQDPHWIMCRGFTSAVCIAIHTSFLDRFLRAAEQQPEGMTVDERYSGAWRDVAPEIWVPHSNPSLVDHIDGEGVLSGHPGVPRKAYHTGTREHWTGKNQELHHRIWGH
jgi:hypothetical protein